MLHALWSIAWLHPPKMGTFKRCIQNAAAHGVGTESIDLMINSPEQRQFRKLVLPGLVLGMSKTFELTTSAQLIKLDTHA
jgi:hypothetical protein